MFKQGPICVEFKNYTERLLFDVAGMRNANCNHWIYSVCINILWLEVVEKGIRAVEAIYVEYCACIMCLDYLHFLNCKDLPSSSGGRPLWHTQSYR